MTIETILKQCETIEEKEYFTVSKASIEKICKNTFPKRASTVSNSKNTSFFIVPRQWHYEEFMDEFKKLIGNMNCVIFNKNNIDISIMKKDNQ